MSAEKKVRNISRPKLSAVEQTQMILNEMLLLRAFPTHEQVNEFRRNLEYARAKLPALYAQAEVQFKESMAAEDRLLEHPEECPRCSGTGIFPWQGALRFCGCRAGDLAARKGDLPDRAPRLVVAPKQMSAGQQLKQIRGLLDDPKGADD